MLHLHKLERISRPVSDSVRSQENGIACGRVRPETKIRTHVSDIFFIFGSLIWFALVWASFQWEARAMRDYMDLYRQRVDPSRSTAEDLISNDPLAWPFPKLFSWLRILWHRQLDPEVEHARRRVHHRWRVSLAVTVLGAAVPIVLSSLTQ